VDRRGDQVGSTRCGRTVRRRGLEQPELPARRQSGNFRSTQIGRAGRRHRPHVQLRRRMRRPLRPRAWQWPNPRRIVERCQRAIAVLSTNPSADLLSTYRVYDESLRKLKRDPAPRGRFARPIYIGESALGPGPDIDEINLGSGLDDMAKLISRPKLAPLPPSPPPGYVPEDFSGHFHLPDQSTEESTYLSARQSKEARLVASGQVESGSKRQRGGAYNALLSTARGQIGFNLVGGYPISGMKGAKTAPGDTGEPMDLGMSSDE